MIRRIVAASDGSDGANRAIDVVASLARGCDAELWLVNAINDHGLSTDQLNEFRHVEHVSLGQFLALLSAQLLMSRVSRAASWRDDNPARVALRRPCASHHGDRSRKECRRNSPW